MRQESLGDPLLAASHGTSGIVKAIEICFPKSIRQRRLTHGMRNLSAKAPKDPGPSSRPAPRRLIKRPDAPSHETWQRAWSATTGPSCSRRRPVLPTTSSLHRSPKNAAQSSPRDPHDKPCRVPLCRGDLPNVLDQIQLGRSRWPGKEGGVSGDLQAIRAMPRGPVEDDDGMSPRFNGPGDLCRTKGHYINYIAASQNQFRRNFGLC